MKKLVLNLVILLFLVLTGHSQGGMWLPNEISGKIEKEMKSFGLKLKAEKIYSEKNKSIKDAIVQFGRGCTGEIISDKGLLITNHHCGYGAIQRLSTVENNLFEKGYWAESFEKELPGKGLTVTFVEKIEDITDQVLNGAMEGMSNSALQSLVDKNIDRIKKETKTDPFQVTGDQPIL